MVAVSHHFIQSRRSRPAQRWLPDTGRIGALALLVLLAGGGPGGQILPSALAGTDLLAQSNLLESVRRNEGRARAICNQLRTLKGQGVPYTSPQANSTIAAQQGVSLMEAEVLITYVVDRHCPDVR